MTRYEEDDVNELRSQLGVAERERDRTLEELKEFKKMMNCKSDAIASEKAKNQEMNSLKESLLNANKELRNKNKTIESLRYDFDQMKQLELKLEEKDTCLHMMKEELSNLKSSMGLTEGLLSDTKTRVVELEVEVGMQKETEAKLEEALILLEKSKTEIASLHEKMQVLEEENCQKHDAAKEIIDSLGNELQVVKEDYDMGSAKSSSLEAPTSFDDVESLKNELKQAIEAEDNSKKAMDDFAVALKEVTSSSHLTKEKLKFTEQQLEAVTEEALNLKKMVKSTEQTYETLVNKLKMERDRLKNTVGRLRLEAEESLLAWNEKEIEFVKCIKEAEDERYVILKENKKLSESLRVAEAMNYKSKDEIRKLRDILKQALNEANVAKEAANLARTENSFLKDFLTEKDRALVSLAQENETLRMNEAEANEHITELKRLVKLGFITEKEQKKASKKDSSGDSNDKESKGGRKFSFDLNQLCSGTPKSEPENDDALGGSIFDILEAQVKEEEASSHHHQASCSGCSDDEKILNLENFEEGEQFDDLDMDRSPQGKRKALIKRFGDLLRRKKFSSSQPQGSLTKDLPQAQKEITV